MLFATRFAPSPTGLLHLGHAFSALTAHDAARAAGGRFLLRIEDLDVTRCRSAFEVAILDDLAWLGISWDAPPRRQSEHMETYRSALEALARMDLVYRCFRTRKEVLADLANAPHGPSEAFRGAPLDADEEEARLARGEAFAWRLSLDRARDWLGPRWDQLGFEAEGAWRRAEPERHGDVVLARKEFPASYHLASVLDDAEAEITCVIRGEDLADAAHLHVLLQALFGLPTPAYRHHRLILGDDGKRLAKRDRAETLQSLRQAGLTPADIRKRLSL